MNRRLRTLIVLVVALAMAGLASFGVYRAIQRIPVREVEIARMHVVVAARPVPMGTLVAPDDVKVVAWPAQNPLQGGFSDVKAVIGRGVVASVIENEPLTESKLAARDAGAGLPPTIQVGMRDISVKVNEVIGVAGFVVPGTRVDVIVVANRGGSGGDSMSRAIVGNVQVLTAGTRIDQDKAKGGEPIPTTVVTLMVTPQDAERIVLASAQGQIMLALRNPLDVQPTQTAGVRLFELMGPAAPPPPVERIVRGRPVVVVAPPPPPPPKIYTVEAIRAQKRAEEPVK